MGSRKHAKSAEDGGDKAVSEILGTSDLPSLITQMINVSLGVGCLLRVLLAARLFFVLPTEEALHCPFACVLPPSCVSADDMARKAIAIYNQNSNNNNNVTKYIASICWIQINGIPTAIV